MSAVQVRERALLRPIWLAGPRADVLALATLLAALVPALAPLASTGMAATHDGLLHLQRLVALESAARHGTPFTRWLPDLAYGYGQPLFNYYAPLAYAPALLARSLGLDLVASFELGTAALLVLSAYTMYVCARALFGPVGALAGALVYAYLPYQLVDVYVRGALAETAAFVWLPPIAWCLIEGRRACRARWTVGLAFAVAGLILTHNITAFLAAPAFAALAAVLWRERLPGQSSRLASGWSRPASGAALGIALSAWFWLPAILERDLVQIGETIEPHLFASFFIWSWPPFTLDRAYDYVEPVSTALGSPIFWPQLGLVQMALTLLGGLGARQARGHTRGVLLWASGLAVVSFLLQLGPAKYLFDLLPLASFVQFPWRLLALLGFASALLAGALVEYARPKPATRLLVGAVVVGVSIWTAVWGLSPSASYPESRYLTPDGILRAEMADYALGTTHSGEYLPVASGIRDGARFRKELLDGPPRAAVPAGPTGLRVRDLDWSPHRIRLRVETPTPDRVLLHQFAFPGWAASVDGRDVPLADGGRFGLLAIDVPAGDSSVEVRWDWTSLRLGALIASLATLAALVFVAVVTRRPSPRMTVAASTLAVGVALVVSCAGSPPALAQAGPQTPRQIGDRLALVRADLDAARVAVDGTIEARLTWQALDRLPAGAAVTLVVEGADGAAHGASWAHGGLARHWEPNEIVQTVTTPRLPAGFPAGPARISAQVSVSDQSATLELGTLDVAPRSVGRSIPRAAPVFNGVVALDRRLVTQSGDWQAARAGDWVDADVTFAVPHGDVPHLDLAGVLVVRGGSRELQSDAHRVGDWFAPLPFWQAGDVWRQRVRLRLPRDVQPGDYESHLRLYGRELGVGGMAQPGASSWRPRGRPIAEFDLGNLTVRP